MPSRIRCPVPSTWTTRWPGSWAGSAVAEEFLARSRPGSGLRLLDAGHRVMAEFSRDHEAGVHGFPQANMFHQPDLEELPVRPGRPAPADRIAAGCRGLRT